MKSWVTVFFLTFSLLCRAEERKEFDILVAGIKIGELSARKVTRDSITSYSIASTVNFWFFVRVKVDYSITSRYKNGKLISSFVETRSSKGDFKSSVVWQDDHYSVKVDTYKYKRDTVLFLPIYFNVARLYFDEPDKVENMLADNYGQMAPSKKLEANVYQVIVTGNANRYYYKTGEMEKAIMHNPIKNFEIRRRTGNDD
jgi:hypothetical protein